MITASFLSRYGHTRQREFRIEFAVILVLTSQRGVERDLHLELNFHERLTGRSMTLLGYAKGLSVGSYVGCLVQSNFQPFFASFISTISKEILILGAPFVIDGKFGLYLAESPNFF